VSSFLHIIESVKLVVKECSHKSDYKRVSTLFGCYRCLCL